MDISLFIPQPEGMSSKVAVHLPKEVTNTDVSGEVENISYGTQH